MVLRLVFKGAPRWISCLLWALVAIRLVCPFVIESELSLIPDFSVSQGDKVASVEYVPDAKLLTQAQNIPPVSSTETTVHREQSSVDIGKICAIVWLCGAGLMLTYGIVSYVSMRLRVKESVPLRENIRQSDRVNSPFILGVLRPFIYIPFRLNKKTEMYVLAHEQAHLKRLDHIWKPLGFILLCIHWFNPLVWVSYVLLCRDIEVACDEKVVCKYDLESRKNYATALLDCKVSRRMITACPVAFGEVGVGVRIKKTLKYKRASWVVIAVAMLLVLVASACLLTDPVPEIPTVSTSAPSVQTPPESGTNRTKNESEQLQFYVNNEAEKSAYKQELHPDLIGGQTQSQTNDTEFSAGYIEPVQQESPDVSDDNAQPEDYDTDDTPAVNVPEVAPEEKTENDAEPPSDVHADVPTDAQPDSTQRLEAIAVPQIGMGVEEHFDSSNNELFESLMTHVITIDTLQYNNTGYVYWE